MSLKTNQKERVHGLHSFIMVNVFFKLFLSLETNHINICKSQWNRKYQGGNLATVCETFNIFFSRASELRGMLLSKLCPS